MFQAAHPRTLAIYKPGMVTSVLWEHPRRVSSIISCVLIDVLLKAGSVTTLVNHACFQLGELRVGHRTFSLFTITLFLRINHLDVLHRCSPLPTHKTLC